MNSMTHVTCFFSSCDIVMIPMGGPRALPEVLCALGRLSAAMGDVSYSSFAPAPAETDGEASNPGPGLHRPRKRGPRSLDAKELRLIKHRIKWAQEVARNRTVNAEGSEPEPDSIAILGEQRVCVWHCNIQSFHMRCAELAARIRLAECKPDVICLNETNLQPFTEFIEVEGYVVAARRDRSAGRRGGGVLVLVRTGIAEAVTCVKECSDCERLWLVVHSCLGPMLLGCWYRPPDSGINSISSLGRDLEELSTSNMSVLVFGDMNVHHERWLKFSNGTSAEGRLLYNVTSEHGLEQHVKAPTRQEYLLDLCLSNMRDVRCSVLPKIADHSIVETVLVLPIAETVQASRKVWLMGAGDWQRLSENLQEHDWSSLGIMDPDEGAEYLTRVVLQMARECIPEKTISAPKRKHPWLNNEVLELVRGKVEAEGTAKEAEAVRTCSEGVRDAYHKWVAQTREEMLKLPRGSKQWWSKTNCLLSKAQKACSINALKNSSGKWVREARDKADLFAETFASKCKLAEAEVNDFSHIEQRTTTMDSLRVLTTHDAMQVLKDLDASSATGPDLLPSRILRECADVLALPVLLLANQILRTGRWPVVWLMHWIVPLYKKKTVFNPANYRGVHLTAQLSKVVERLLGMLWLPDIAKQPEFCGPNQFAYLPEKGARDALAVMVTTWLLGLQSGQKFGLYCSDVSGAFDRVDADRLKRKLEAKGFREDMFRVIASWLRQRTAHVIVGGAQSHPMELLNQVFQGTVWGPPLWNLFFEDARLCLEVIHFAVMVFADDLNAFKQFPNSVDNGSIMSELETAQNNLHQWGRANRVCFDAGKESSHVLSHREPAGGNFKILGVNFDCKLLMTDAVMDVAIECGWKLERLLHSKRFFNGKELISLYKAHVLSFIEYRTSAIYHASTSTLSSVDRVQERMLGIAGASELEALFVHNLAPLRTRRDIAMLGVIHRAALGEGPKQLQSFFFAATRTGGRRTRLQCNRHFRQLHEYKDGHHTDYIGRSILGLVSIYNLLPWSVVTADGVSKFQTALQNLVKEQALAGDDRWADLLSPRIEAWHHPLMRLCMS